MDSSEIRNEVLKMIFQVPLLGVEELELRPASETDIRDFENRFAIGIPPELREWFRVCNGAPVNPGGLLSLEEIGRYYEWHPAWIEKGWIPLASDGCGNSYILATRERIKSTLTHPIHFVDQSDYLCPAYVVASGLWNFLRFLFKNEILSKDFVIKPEYYAEELIYDIEELKGERYWPFDKDKVLEEDPGLADYSGVTLFPWETE